MAFFAALQREPDLKGINITQIITFTRLLSLLKHDIILCQPVNISTTEPPDFLPPTIRTFISEATGIGFDTIPKCWHLLKEDIWESPQPQLSAEEENLFRENGWKMGINCNTNYHHNFSIQDGVRTYYGDTPKYIQVGEHQFVEHKLIGLWISLMLVAWVSATNCARSYDMALSEQQERDFAAGGWQFGCVLTTDHVWDAFVILTLLNYNDRKGTCLQVPHTGDQRDRFTGVMRERNREVIEEGQDEVGHCCDKCMHTLKRPDGSECTFFIQLYFLLHRGGF
ncbi:hypothetical protein MVEN_02359200 [Mycena venus]|uniref:CxC5 like cysteine cluster associated with KDZ domain-containing protein n=1 Tax=Mycena venus TaxID=2733690 RepID=A0A8H7CFE1_9AGAR|nr:hypothetical protein MVEN_02359200 [Mycena venus]